MIDDDNTVEGLLRMAIHALDKEQQAARGIVPRKFVAQSHIRGALRALNLDVLEPRVGEFNVDSGTERLEDYFYANHHGQTRDSATPFPGGIPGYVRSADDWGRFSSEGYPIRDRIYYLGEEPEDRKSVV